MIKAQKISELDDSVSTGPEDLMAGTPSASPPADPEAELLQDVLEKLENSGDLPIFSSSVNQVNMVGSDPDSDAMQLAVEVLKDASLTTKMLRLANSSYYNRSAVKTGSLSRAVVVMGFDAVKSTVMALKLIDSLHGAGKKGHNMNSMLVNSYMTAGLVKEVAAASGIKNFEQSYVCGLMHNLGEVIVAHTLPEKYREMKQLAEDSSKSWVDVQKKVLGIPLYKVGKGVVEKWQFPESVTKTIAPHVNMKRKANKQDEMEMNRSLSSLSTSMMDLLYSDNPTTQQSFAEITKELSSVSGLNEEVLGVCLDKSFKQSCELAEDYGLDKSVLIPKGGDTDDEERDIIARKLGVYAGYEEPEAEDDMFETDDYDDGYDTEAEELLSPEEEDDVATEVTPGGDTSIMLTVLQELTDLMSNGAHLNTVFNKVLEGMHRGVGFDRAMLCLISPDHKSYSGRMVTGYKAEVMQKMFNECKVDRFGDLFSKMILEDRELLIKDVGEGNWLQKLPAGFEENVGAKSILIAALRVRKRPVGMFYVDKSRQQTAITGEDQRGFLQLVAQAQLALQVR